ncbi:MAG TPA: hypothetical protein VFH44_04520 [Solirubrobacterales bacterium]|nr:hypothetical protein [Solirubrobacterales bacterium]
MGILDDAIREHLELKRQHGAASSELDQLEQEVFGPVARPGDPEFETGEEPAAGEHRVAEAAGGDDPTTVLPQSGAEPESVEQPVPEAPEAEIFDVDEVALGDIDLDEELKTPAERAREEHSHLEDTVDHPAPEVASLEEELEAAAPAPAAPDSDQLDPPAASPVEEPEPGDPEIPASNEEPESLEFDELPGEPVEPRARRDDDESDDDLLEETPDFLKDAPDGEDLWFEQGKPKDFDF